MKINVFFWCICFYFASGSENIYCFLFEAIQEELGSTPKFAADELQIPEILSIVKTSTCVSTKKLLKLKLSKRIEKKAGNQSSAQFCSNMQLKKSKTEPRDNIQKSIQKAAANVPQKIYLAGGEPKFTCVTQEQIKNKSASSSLRNTSLNNP